MSSSSLQLFLFSVACGLLFCATAGAAQMNINNLYCPTSDNYTSGSPFEANLNQALQEVTRRASSSGFAAWFPRPAGRRCRLHPRHVLRRRRALRLPELPPQRHLATSIQTLKNSCPRGKQAAIWYDACFLRYSDASFFRTPDSSTGARLLLNTQHVDPSVQPLFPLFLGDLMGQLTTSVAGNQPRSAAYGLVTIDQNHTVNGVAQCTQDLSISDCTACLQFWVNNLPVCCNTTLGARIFSLSCYLRYESSITLSLSSLFIPPPPPPTAPPPDHQGSKVFETLFYVLLAVSVVVALSASAFLIFWTSKQKERQGGPAYGSRVAVIDPEILRKATNNFAQENKIGKGGFGEVYKGMLPGQLALAVKKLSNDNWTEGLPQLQNEIDLLAKLRHKNLVEILGYCIKESESFLCYEYLPNGSLDKILFRNPNERMHLDWDLRHKIIKGVACGLVYLHMHFQERIVHRDLKPSNILLDRNMNPKISDFGLAKFFLTNESHLSISALAGTAGYIAPECWKQMILSTKSDVYSFGIIVLEIIAGRKNFGNNIQALTAMAWQSWSNGRLEELKDPGLGDECLGEAVRCMHIALLCIQDNPNSRPDMETVNFMLDKPSYILPAPSPTELIVFSDDSQVELVVMPTTSYDANGRSKTRTLQPGAR